MSSEHDKNILVVDCEVYPNYFLAACASYTEGSKVPQVRTYEITNENQHLHESDIKSLVGLIDDCDRLVTFNGTSYDLPILTQASLGKSARQIYETSLDIITNGRRRPQYLKNRPERHVDTQLLLPMPKSLKLSTANLHAKTIEDLPFPPTIPLSDDEMKIVKEYCGNDLEITKLLYDFLNEELDIRLNLDNWLSEQGIDPSGIAPSGCQGATRPQLGERVVKALAKYREYKEPYKPTNVRYQPPEWVWFNDAKLQQALQNYSNESFRVTDVGRLAPARMSGLFNGSSQISVECGDKVFSVGLGGTHTNHSRGYGEWYETDAQKGIYHYDVTSYYPNLIINSGRDPFPGFQRAFSSMIDRRVEAKREGDKKTSDALKIVINSVFGKLLDLYSDLYDPSMFLEVTATGQFALLMLTERLHDAGAEIVQANTDGVVVVHDHGSPKVAEALASWQNDTNLELEETRFTRFAQRDVNSYIGVEESGKVKAIGALDPDSGRQNLDFPIVRKAVAEWIKNKTPLDDTIHNANDIRDFVRVGNTGKSKSGQDRKIFLENGEPLGKVARWYIATDGNQMGIMSGPVDDLWRPIEDATVRSLANSQNGVLVQTLPDEMPDNVDRGWYINKAIETLRGVGAEKAADEHDQRVNPPECDLGLFI